MHLRAAELVSLADFALSRSQTARSHPETSGRSPSDSGTTVAGSLALRAARLSEESGIPRVGVKGRVRKTSPAVSLQSMLFPFDSAVVSGFDGRCLPVPDALALCSSESEVVQPKPLVVAAQDRLAALVSASPW